MNIQSLLNPPENIGAPLLSPTVDLRGTSGRNELHYISKTPHDGLTGLSDSTTRSPQLPTEKGVHFHASGDISCEPTGGDDGTRSLAWLLRQLPTGIEYYEVFECCEESEEPPDTSGYEVHITAEGVEADLPSWEELKQEEVITGYGNTYGVRVGQEMKVTGGRGFVRSETLDLETGEK
ncbi:hypothetical protein KVT40_001890 [Elsinoe batatas]|uniref:Uncharacterized protein n=1 Tax=Elsinoe batatas TaxID=2601811 RepID=A0A8K0PHP5_9PEZI|nr:hypothetical protein KVT40_001890 [Elsinoe batatas]